VKYFEERVSQFKATAGWSLTSRFDFELKIEEAESLMDSMLKYIVRLEQECIERNVVDKV
jgi:hypothetical protein